MEHTPFDTVESAEEFLHLLHVEIEKAQSQINELLAETERDKTAERRLEALRLVMHKLLQLSKNTDSSLRLLHDLKTLRKLLLR